ncbi:MAG: hypothetical protein Fur0022_28320 [Anaerolineales bacterium]
MKPIKLLLIFLSLFTTLTACVPLVGTIEVGVETPSIPTEITEIPAPTPTLEFAPEPTPSPASTAQTGISTGRVCYPSEFIPAMTAYFQEVGTGDLTELAIAENQNTYSVELPIGTYRAFAYVETFQLSGGYTAYVACGYAETCTDHTLMPFTIEAGQTQANIDLCDWPMVAEQLPLPTNVNPPAAYGDDAILILEPGPGSRVTSPLHISGMADPTFEQNLVVRIVLDDGTEIALTPTTIQADLGLRGPFSIDIPLTITGERQAFIQVYTTSARDGGITHLSSVGVTLTESGPVEIRPVTDTSERINIYTPTLGGTVSGGVAHIEGFALASFEQHLLVEVVDENGNVIGSSPVTVAAPDLGMPGPFTVDVPYTLSTAGPGRIVVRDPSAAFDGDVHIASVEVQLEP